MTNKKTTDKPTTEAKADVQETKPAAKKADKLSGQQFQVWYGGIQLDVTDQRTEGDVTYLQCSEARQAYPEAATAGSEEVSEPDIHDPAVPPATDPAS